MLSPRLIPTCCMVDTMAMATATTATATPTLIGSVHGRAVDATLLGAEQFDEAVLAPAFAPAVAHQPVVVHAQGAKVRSVSDQLDAVVDGDVLVEGAAGKDSAGVGVPHRRVHGDRQRSNLGQMGHDGVMIVGGKRVVAGQSNLGETGVVDAGLGVAGVTGHVGVVRVGHHAKELEVVEPELGDGPLATARTTALQGIR